MTRIIICLTTQHDWRLVLLAAAVCFLASVVAISLFRRVQASAGREQLVWLGLDAVAAGYGIWATHFIAMLAYEPGTGAGYGLALTAVSLLLAILVTGAGLTITLLSSIPFKAVIGGGLFGVGVAAMHFIGMFALESSGPILWSPDFVVAAVALGIVFGSLSFLVAMKTGGYAGTLVAAALLALSVCTMHFTAMSAVLYLPNQTDAGGTFLSASSLSLAVAGIAVAILCMCLVAALSDRQSKDRLRQQKMLLDAAVENMSQGLCMYDADGRVMLLNERFATKTGLSALSLKATSMLNLLEQWKASGEFSADPEEFYGRLLADAETGKSQSDILRTSAERTLRLVFQPMRRGGWVVTLEDITERQQMQAQVVHMARHDTLTDLPNRTRFREDVAAALHRRSGNEHVAVLCLDLDRFKDVNDAFGHAIGDEVLKSVANRLRKHVRKGSVDLYRLGGDEFAIVQIGNHLRASESQALAGRLLEDLGAAYQVGGQDISLRASAGIALTVDGPIDPDELVRNADLALERSKADGRGTYRLFEGGMAIPSQSRLSLEFDLRSALAHCEFEMRYQPVYDLTTERITHFEALVRWNHPDRGELTASELIRLAEETALIVPVGDWVLRKACRDAAGWPTELPVAVNISPAQFTSRNLVSSVAEALSSSGLSPARLELEIREAVLWQDLEAALTVMHRLRKMGVKIALDGVGAGDSSLHNLLSFPFERFKIDQSLLSAFESSEGSKNMVHALVGLGKNMGVATTAVGVETRGELDLLRQAGCTQAQGNFLAPPHSAVEVDEMLASAA